MIGGTNVCRMSVTHSVLRAAALKSRSRSFRVPLGRAPCGLLPPLPPLRYSVQSGPAHQARHAVATAPLPRRNADLPRCADSPRLPHGAMQHTDLPQQLSIVLGPRTRRPGPPAIVPAGGDSQTSAHHPDGKGLAASLDHPILHRDALAMNAADSRKKSRSFLTRANSRRRRARFSSRTALAHEPHHDRSMAHSNLLLGPFLALLYLSVC